MHNSAQLRCFENGNDDFGVEAFWIGDAARVGYFVLLNGPLNGHPPSVILNILPSCGNIVVVFAVGHLLQLALVTTSPSLPYLRKLWFLPITMYTVFRCLTHLYINVERTNYSRTPDERPPSPTTIPLIYDHISCDGLCILFVYESLTSDHPSYTTTPMWFWGWSYKRGSTVLCKSYSDDNAN